MRWLKKQYHRYMIRPIVTKTSTRTLIGLVIVLLWDKYVNVERIGVSRLGFGLGAVGIILMAGAWFSYLHLDGLTPIDTAKKKFGVKNKKKKTTLTFNYLPNKARYLYSKSLYCDKCLMGNSDTGE